jgi:hypothetical protein
MKRTSIALFIILSLSMVSLSFSTTYAIQQEYKARFYCYTIGECAILPEWILGPSPVEEVFIGKGIMSLCGSAAVDECPPNYPNIPHTYYVASDGVRASGKIYAEWPDHFLTIFLYSSDKTNGFFIDEGDMIDTFIVGLFPGSNEIPSISFRGIYKDSKGMHIISGKAGVLVFPVGDSAILLMGAILYKSDNTPLMTILWTPTDLNLGPPVFIHAASLFRHSVNIKL